VARCAVGFFNQGKEQICCAASVCCGKAKLAVNERSVLTRGIMSRMTQL